MGQDKFDVSDHAINAFQGILKCVSAVGPLIERVIFGKITELRMRRIESVLRELAGKLGTERANNVASEEFISLFESVAPDISRAINESKRQCLRDLLFNAAKESSSDTDWEAAQLASRLIKEIDGPGLQLLAAVGRCKGKYPVSIVAKPEPQVYVGEFDFDNSTDVHYKLNNQWVVVEYWARNLRDKRIISYATHDARGGFGGASLGPIGELLIQWVLD